MYEARLGLPHGKPAQRNALHRRDQRSDRQDQHRSGSIEGFSKEHGCTLLVWFEGYDDLQQARLRELQMKKWKRAWKIELIERGNPQWKDLYGTLF